MSYTYLNVSKLENCQTVKSRVVANLHPPSVSQVLAIKKTFDKNLRELHLYYLKSPKHGKFGLSLFWEYLNFNEYYSDIGNEMGYHAFSIWNLLICIFFNLASLITTNDGKFLKNHCKWCVQVMRVKCFITFNMHLVSKQGEWFLFSYLRMMLDYMWIYVSWFFTI